MLPDLDRFSRPGPSEKYPPLRIVQIDPECDVCGRTMSAKFLKLWNDKQVCAPCINEITQDIDA